MAAAEFTINNKVHIATKVSLFIANYGREMRMRGDIRRKEKVESVTEAEVAIEENSGGNEEVCR